MANRNRLSRGLFSVVVILPFVSALFAPKSSARQVSGNQSPSSRPEPVIHIADPGAPPRLAVQRFLALANDSETQAAADVISEVLWNDLDFENEFYVVPRDVSRTVAETNANTEPSYDAWRELGADGVVLGAVQREGNQLRVEMRLYSIRSRQQVYAREYVGTSANPRWYAHTIADEIHQTQRSLRGIARTKLTFASDRDGLSVAGAQPRDLKEIYISDYDGAGTRRITVGRHLNLTPVWSPDGRSLAYTSWRTGFMDILVSRIYEGLLLNPTTGTYASQNYLPMYSPDGTQMAFASTRDGNSEVYVANADGSSPHRLTNHPGADLAPTWSPSGAQIAFVSDRAGPPSIYVVGVDGLGLDRLTFEYSDRPTWSPLPFNEIAYTARNGSGHDIKILDIATGKASFITFGEGSNESPAWAPNGRHIAFASTRAGRVQIFTVARDGGNVRQITRDGNNSTPHWSQ